jgi:hypothetical protein
MTTKRGSGCGRRVGEWAGRAKNRQGRARESK